MKVVLTGGGTGGHIYPAISVGQALREADRSIELLFVGSSHGPEGKLAAEAGIPFRAIPSSPLTKSISLRNMASLGRLMLGVFRARKILRAFGAEVAVGTGGYAAAAVLLAQHRLGGKVVIQEQNVVPGRTNLWLSRIADRICVTFDATLAYFPKGRAEIVGTPIRSDFASLPDKITARRELGLSEELFTILVVGGSQGARGVNNLVLGAWPAIDDGATQLLHQAGARNIEEVRVAVRDLGREAGVRYHVEAYLDMPVALAAADLVIGRSGATTLAELTCVGLPSILIPYPHAITNEQRMNAAFAADRCAAIVCEESECSPEKLADIVTGLRGSPEKLSAMSAASRSIGRPDAAKRLAEIVIEMSGSPGGRSSR